jgi:5-methyltetrahydrofolate--homocysteine methyltransferase
LSVLIEMMVLADRLKLPGVILADGAMGTMLFQRGLKPGDCPERINIERPDVLQEIAEQYLDAGAEIIQTNTFGATPLKLAMYSLEDKTEEINSYAVKAVRKVVGDRAYIAASCGPTGKLLEPYGDTKPEQIYEAYRRQMKTLVAEHADLICIETMTDINEAVLAIKAARSISSAITVCATMTFDITPKGFFTIMGTTIKEASRELANAGANILGSNCGNGIINMIAISKEFKTCATIPIAIQSNAGVPILKETKPIFPETPEFMAEKSQELIEIGVKIIGGCCGTTPAHIAALREVIANKNLELHS